MYYENLKFHIREKYNYKNGGFFWWKGNVQKKGTTVPIKR